MAMRAHVLLLFNILHLKIVPLFPKSEVLQLRIQGYSSNLLKYFLLNRCKALCTKSQRCGPPALARTVMAASGVKHTATSHVRSSAALGAIFKLSSRLLARAAYLFVTFFLKYIQKRHSYSSLYFSYVSYSCRDCPLSL